MDGSSYVSGAILMITAIVVLAIVKHESTISGRVTLPNGRPAAQAIVSFTGSERPKPLAKAIVDQRDRKFIPHISVITVGTEVEFPNHDIISHNVFTEFNSTKFDFGVYPKGTKKHQKFTQPGLAVIMCSIHPDMGAYIMVVDTPFYAMTDKTGRYQIPGMASGRYKVDVWHESGAAQKSEATINGNTQLDLQLTK
jgi:plastocyanin